MPEESWYSTIILIPTLQLHLRKFASLLQIFQHRTRSVLYSERCDEDKVIMKKTGRKPSLSNTSLLLSHYSTLYNQLQAFFGKQP